MCTVTVIPAAASPIRTSRSPLVRLICNRDEQRSRPLSASPVRRRLGESTAIMPIDPRSGGTWIGANSSGLVASLLNSNPTVAPGTSPKQPPRASRGTIVPTLLTAETMKEVLALAGDIDVTRFPPFRVLVLNTDSFIVASSDGASLTLSEALPLAAPLLLTSSGLGDHLVESPRRELFEQLLSSAPDPHLAQTLFHEHHWKDMPQISVLMSRPDARTVSRCVVDLYSDSLVLTHCNLTDRLVADGPISRSELSLLRAEVTA